MDVQISTPSSDVNDAEKAVTFAREALEDARLATRAAESVFLARRADETDAQRVYDRATELVRDIYVAERQRLEEAARIADAALRELDDKLHALRPGEDDTDPGRRDTVDLGAEESPAAAIEPPSVDAHAGADAEDWLDTLRRESEDERRAPDGA